MKYIKIIIFFFLLFFAVVGVKSQTPAPTPLIIPTPSNHCKIEPTDSRCNFVVTTQGLIDDSNKAFKLVPELQKQVENLLSDKKISDQERQAYIQLKLDLEDVANIRSKIIDQYVKMLEVYDKVIKIQSDLIDKLTSRLNKKKSTFEKIIGILKRIGDVAIGVAIGRIL